MDRLAKAFFGVSLMTLVSRILGFVRDVFIARIMGASWQMDAFLLVFKLPNLFRRFFAEGAFSQAMVPMVCKKSLEKNFLSSMFFLLLLGVGCISLPFYCFPEFMLRLLAPGLQNDLVKTHALLLLPKVFTYLFAMSCCSFYGVQLSAKKVFSVGACLPILLNIMLLLGIYQYQFSQNLMVMADMVLFAGLSQLLLCFLAVWYQGGVLFPRYQYGVALKKTFTEMGEGMLAQLIRYLSSFMDIFLISFLATGSFSWLYYAERLVFLPIGVIAVSLANTQMPNMTEAYMMKKQQVLRNILAKSLHLLLLCGVPLAIGGVCLAREIITLLFSSQRFGLKDVEATSQVFSIFCMGLPMMMLNRFLGNLPYVFENAKQHRLISFKAFICGLVVSLLGLSTFGCLAIAFGSVVNAGVSFFYLNQYMSEVLGGKIWCYENLTKILIAIIGVVMVFLVFPMHVSHKLGLLLLLISKTVVAFSLYLYTLYRLNVNIRQLVIFET